jgi:hypothetical protein
VIASIWTTAASIIAAIIDGMLGYSTIIPPGMQRRLFPALSDDRLNERERLEFWQKISSLSIRVLADTQAFMGLSLITCAYINIPAAADSTGVLGYQDAHFTLAVYLACLSSSSHVASLLVMRDQIDTHRTTTLIRVVVMSIFALLLTITIDLSSYAFQPFFVGLERLLIWKMHVPETAEWILEYALPPMVMIYIFWISITQLLFSRTYLHHHALHLLWRKLRRFTIGFALDWLKSERRLGIERYDSIVSPVKTLIRFCVFSHPMVIFLLQIAFAVISLVFALCQKFTQAPVPTETERAQGIKWCSLSNYQENGWNYGQSAAIILLLIPLYSTFHEYYGS